MRIEPDRQIELMKHVVSCTSDESLLQTKSHEMPGIIQRLSRTALGFSPDIEISNLPETQRNELLVVMRGISEIVYSK